MIGRAVTGVVLHPRVLAMLILTMAGVVLHPASWPCAPPPWPAWCMAHGSLAAGWVTVCVASSFMPHFGQRPGWSLVTSGCIGQA